MRTFVVPHVLEQSGSVKDTAGTLNTGIVVTCTSQTLGADTGHQATASLYLHDESGQAPQGAPGLTGCNPCSIRAR